MKKLILITVLLCLTLSGCANAAVPTSAPEDNTKSKAESVASVSNAPKSESNTQSAESDITRETERKDYPDLPEAFANILNGGEFIDEDEKVTNLNECDKLKSRNSRPEKYALIDLDKDGDDEFVVAICDYECYFIFHTEKDEKIYCHYFGYRWFESPKADGRFWGAGGAGIGAVLRIASFEKTKYTETELCECNDYEQIYKINSKPASKAEAQAYLEDFEKVEDLKWTVLQ